MSKPEHNRAYYHRNIEAQRERGRKKYRDKVGTIEGCVDNLWRGAKQRATKKGLPFDLSKDWLKDRVEAGRCEVTGIPFSYEVTGAFRFYGATVDRKVPELGYTQSNCQVVIWGYSAAKGNGSHDDVMQLAHTLVANDNNK